MSIEHEALEVIEMDFDLENPAVRKRIIDNSTQLYAEPMVSAVREAISNGYDAIMRAVAMGISNVRNIHITLPTAENEYNVVIEDTGTGMTMDVIRKNYAKYDSSDKSNMVGQLGNYGYGAKAPLAYAKSFTVETTVDGETIVFKCVAGEFKNETFILSREHTGRKNGTIVSIPIKREDLKKLEESVHAYGKFPTDVNFYVNGVKLKPTSDYILLDTVLLSKDDPLQRKSDIWVPKVDYLKNLVGKKDLSATNIVYNLAGYSYESPQNNSALFAMEDVNRYVNRYQNNTQPANYSKPIVVQIHSDMVDFTPSREKIKNNERSLQLHKTIVNKFLSHTSEALISAIVAVKEQVGPTALFDSDFLTSFKSSMFGGTKFVVENRDDADGFVYVYSTIFANGYPGGTLKEKFGFPLATLDLNDGSNIIRYVNNVQDDSGVFGVFSTFNDFVSSPASDNIMKAFGFDLIEESKRDYDDAIEAVKHVNNKPNLVPLVPQYRRGIYKINDYFSNINNYFDNNKFISMSGVFMGEIPVHRKYFSDSKLKVVVLENMNSKHIKKVRSNRPYLFNNMENIVFVLHKGEVDYVEIDCIQRHFPLLSFEIQDADDFFEGIEKAKKKKPTNRKKPTNSSFSSASVPCFMYAKQLTIPSTIQKTNRAVEGLCSNLYKAPTMKCNIEDFFDADTAIVFYNSTFKINTFFNDVLNRNDDIFDKKILFVYQRNVVGHSQVMNNLVDNHIDRLYSDNEFNYHFKGATKLYKRLRHSDVLNLDLAQFSDLEILVSMMRADSVPVKMDLSYFAPVMTEYTFGTKYEEAANILADLKLEASNNYNFINEIVKKRLSHMDGFTSEFQSRFSEELYNNIINVLYLGAKVNSAYRREQDRLLNPIDNVKISLIKVGAEFNGLDTIDDTLGEVDVSARKACIEILDKLNSVS